MNWLKQLWASLVRRHLVAPDPHPESVPPWVYDAAPPERYRLRVCRACGVTVVAGAGLAHVCAGRVVITEDDGEQGVPT